MFILQSTQPRLLDEPLSLTSSFKHINKAYSHTMSAPEPVFVQQITEWLSSEQNIATVDELGKRACGRLAYSGYALRGC